MRLNTQLQCKNVFDKITAIYSLKWIFGFTKSWLRFNICSQKIGGQRLFHSHLDTRLVVVADGNVVYDPFSAIEIEKSVHACGKFSMIS